MCLDIVDEVFRESGDEVLRGYKVFVLREGVVEFQYHLWNGEREVPTRRWIDAEQVHLVSACGTEYISGFHIFKDMGDACGWMVVGSGYIRRRGGGISWCCRLWDSDSRPQCGGSEEHGNS
jgi:hypothetical protein